MGEWQVTSKINLNVWGIQFDIRTLWRDQYIETFYIFVDGDLVLELPVPPDVSGSGFADRWVKTLTDSRNFAEAVETMSSLHYPLSLFDKHYPSEFGE